MSRLKSAERLHDSLPPITEEAMDFCECHLAQKGIIPAEWLS